MTLGDSGCAACGATSDLVDNPEVDVTFCRVCLDHTRNPEILGDEMYYTLGGEA